MKVECFTQENCSMTSSTATHDMDVGHYVDVLDALPWLDSEKPEFSSKTTPLIEQQQINPSSTGSSDQSIAANLLNKTTLESDLERRRLSPSERR